MNHIINSFLICTISHFLAISLSEEYDWEEGKKKNNEVSQNTRFSCTQWRWWWRWWWSSFSFVIHSTIIRADSSQSWTHCWNVCEVLSTLLSLLSSLLSTSTLFTSIETRGNVYIEAVYCRFYVRANARMERINRWHREFI